ncbi:MAG TPA: type II secretion system F family protein [Chloroflexota bacterium]|nr:type II secretion system F family protein [Chloroflexota bacterium]
MEVLVTLAALAAAGATFCFVLALGRPFLLHQRVVRRAHYYLALDAEKAPSTPLQRALVGLAAFAQRHRDTLLAAAIAVALLGFGSLLFGRAVGSLLALSAVGIAVWRYLRRAAQRRDLLETQLVPALRLMASALESGFSIPQALERVVQDSPPPIREEFALVTRAVELGTPFETALTALAKRGDDFEFFATIVAVQYRVGGDLPHLLATLANTVQERVSLRAEVRALTAQARYSGWVLTALPFVVLGWMLLVSPQYVRPLFTTPAGHTLLALAGLLLIAGLVLIRAISHVEI